MKLAMIFSVVGFATFSLIAQAAEIEACSSYVLATEGQHANSARSNFNYKAAKYCADQNSSSWEVVSSRWTPGINVRHYCLHGIIVCN